MVLQVMIKTSIFQKLFCRGRTNWSFRNKNLQDRNYSFFMTQVNILVIKGEFYVNIWFFWSYGPLRCATIVCYGTGRSHFLHLEKSYHFLHLDFWPFSPPRPYYFRKYQNLHYGAFVRKYHFLHLFLRKIPNSPHVSVLDDK